MRACGSTSQTEVEKLKQLSVPVVVDQNATVRGFRDWRATVGWSILAEVVEFPVFPMVVHADPTGMELGSNLNVTVIHTVLLAPSDISSLPCSQLFTQSSTHQSSCTEHTVRATSERCIVVMCPLGRSWFWGHWEHKNSPAELRSRIHQRRSALGALGVWMLGRASKGRRDHGAAAMSVECRESRGDICREAARRHQRELVAVSRVSRGSGALAGAQGNGQESLTL